MLRIDQIKLNPDHSCEDLRKKIAHILRLHEQDIIDLQIHRQSIDARKKPDVKYVYTVDVKVEHEQQVLKRCKGKQVSQITQKEYRFPASGVEMMGHRPIVIGSGPAGLFCAYFLALNGYKPMLFERGTSVEQRLEDVETFWETGVLKPNSNVQFGEGGAGTFSDGKLNTLTKDKEGRNRKVLEVFVDHGAPKEILYQSKPHIGTDNLVSIVKNMRNRIIQAGGSVYFNSQLTDMEVKNGVLKSISITDEKGTKTLPASVLVLAIGHSARDTFQMLYEKQLPMRAKSFAVGVRIEHLQSTINKSQYGELCKYNLPAAPYKVATTLENGRGVYSFCMCPGGYVVNASSEDKRLAINGMSYYARDGKNANSAIIVTVTPEDFGNENPLAGIEFQRKLEEDAFAAGKGKIPMQRFKDFCDHKDSSSQGVIEPQTRGNGYFTNIRDIFPKDIAISIEEGIKVFDKQIHGFANDDAILSAVESRTSSPVRILRNDTMQIDDSGIYPCGEGAGYAGGITSAAVDGIKVAEMIAKKYRKFD